MRYVVGLWVLLVTITVQAGEMLIYSSKEPGSEAYVTRVLVTDKFLRIDGGIDDDGFVLLNREKQLISNVNMDDRIIFEIPYQEVSIPAPMKLELTTRKVPSDPNAPMVAGQYPRHFEMQINGNSCYNVVAVDGLMEESVAALREFNDVLASQRLATLATIPADMLEECELSIYNFYPNWGFDFGLPIQMWEVKQERSQVLMDYQPDYAIDDKLFTLPEGFDVLRSGL